MNYRIKAKEAIDPIVINGIIDEKSWEVAEMTEKFTRITPIDTGYAQAQTEVQLCYDESHLYIAVVCYDPWDGKRPVESLRRDFSFGKNDNFIVFMDTYNDFTNGFAFGVSTAGAQWEGIQANGGFVSLDWDGKWQSAVQNEKDRWTIEMAIPFRTIRYRVGVKEWGINFSRLDLKGNEKSSWAPVPRQLQSANLRYAGTLDWEEPPPDLGLRFSVIPYISAMTSKNHIENTPSNHSLDAGLDAKVTFSTSLNLDLTLNPDFSQVEVDQQVTNLDRFELFFPERRQFFLENSDLFANLGIDNNRPFFSRRIGLASPVIAGVRLSGKIGEDWRIGVMNMQTNSSDNVSANNFTVATIQRNVFKRSNINAFIVNKEPTGKLSDENAYNRVIGFDFNLASADNRWTGKIFYHQALYSGADKDAFSTAAMLNYQTQKLNLSLLQSFIGKNYSAETGFIRRTDIINFSPAFEYKFYPNSQSIVNHGPFAQMDLILNTEAKMTDRLLKGGYQVTFYNQAKIELAIGDQFVLLRNPFDPTNTGNLTLDAGEEFAWQSINLKYNSDPRKLFNYQFELLHGGYFNGKISGLSTILSYRIQPWGNFSFVGEYNAIRLPRPFKDENLLLLGPRFDFTFTKSLFFTSFLQYNKQIDNFNINLRMQWRFAPVSDLFIVYTSNSDVSGFETKNRAIVAKLSYWLN